MATKRNYKSKIRNLGSQDEEEPAARVQPPEISALDDDNEVQRVKKDDDVDGAMLSKSLTRNTYSVIYVANPKSWAFFYGIVFFFIQICLISFALIGAFGMSYYSTMWGGRLLCSMFNQVVAHHTYLHQRCRIKQFLPGTGRCFYMGPNIRIHHTSVVRSTVRRSLGYHREYP